MDEGDVDILSFHQYISISTLSLSSSAQQTGRSSGCSRADENSVRKASEDRRLYAFFHLPFHHAGKVGGKILLSRLYYYYYNSVVH